MDIKNFVKLNDEGRLEIDETGFQSGFDAEIRRAVDKYANGKGKDEIRKQLQEEAKLTAEERLKSEREEFEKYKLETKIEINKSKAMAKLEGKNFTDKEIEFILSTVNDDEEKSLSNIDLLVAERTKFVEETNKKAIENLQSQQQSSSTNQFKSFDNQQDSHKPANKPTKSEILSNYSKH